MTKQPIGIGHIGQAVADNVRGLRLRNSLTQGELADYVQSHGRVITRATITEIEAHARRVDVDDLAAFASVFEVSVESLLTPGFCPKEGS